jgi:outer membrane lipoprotein-sorting protein
MKKIIANFILLAFLMATEVHAQQDEHAGQILDKMSQKYQSMPSYKADFSYRMENKMEEIDEKFSGEIIVSGDKYKLKLTEQEIYNDGKTIWTYLVDANEVNVDDYVPEEGDISPSNIYNTYKKGYKYRFLKEMPMGGRTVNIIELQPLKPDDPDMIFFRVVLYIDKDDNLIKSWEMQDRAGSVYTYTINGFDSNFKTDDSMFVFDSSKHPDVEIIDLR